MSTLRVVHPKPGFFLVDARLTVTLDGYVIYDSGFKAGFEVEGPITPGRHLLTTCIGLDVLARKREYELEIPPDDPGGETRWVAILDYSRMWGNFGKKLTLSRG